MKRASRVAIILVPIIVLLIGIGLWRHHYHKIMEAEPEQVDKSTPLQPNATTPEVTPVTPEDNADIEIKGDAATQRKDETISAEKTDNTESSLGDTTLGEIAEEPTLSPKAAAALKAYEEAQLEYHAAYDELKVALEARPLDWDRIGSAKDDVKKVTQHRMDTLSELAVYSDEALQELADTIAQQIEAEGIMADIRADSPADRSLLELFEAISPEERKRIVEAIPKIKEIMKDVYDYEIPQ